MLRVLMLMRGLLKSGKEKIRNLTYRSVVCCCVEGGKEGGKGEAKNMR